MQSNDQIWTAVLEKLKEEYSASVYNLWFSDLTLVFLNSETAVLAINSNLKRDIIEKRFLENISEKLAEIIGFKVTVYIRSTENEEIDMSEFGGNSFVASAKPKEFPETKPISDIRSEPLFYKRNIKGDGLLNNMEYTFDNFIVGSSNKFAHAASVAVSNNPASVYNPLFIHGASGLGKTHLLYAIMNEISKKFPHMNIIYVKGEEFTNELIESITRKTQAQFRNKYRKADVLLIDDIQFIAGKEGIQEEFFHTFNALYEDHKQIILAADRPPRDMKTLEDRLKSRFEWGLIADIQIPDFELRIAIMKNKAKMIDLNIPNEVLTFLAENLRSNIRQLEGAIKKIGAQSFLNGTPITIDLAKSCITDILVGNEPATVTVDRIISKVSKKYGIDEDDIKSRKKTKEIANARHACIYIIRKLTELSLPAIGKIFGRDHTTIMSSLSVVENEIKRNPMYEVEISELIKEIKE